jgi:putative serine protease PepD
VGFQGTGDTYPVSDDWTAPADEPTQPLSRQQPPGPPPSWIPPTPPRPVPLQPLSHTQPRGRVSAWVWPAVSALALVLGVTGGVVGGLVFDRVSDDAPSSTPASPTSGETGTGLESSGVVSVPPLKEGDATVASVAAALLPSTVQISAEYEGEEGGATGSGFVLDSSGHVITNNHVVEQAAEDDGLIELVDNDGNRYDATVVGRSPVYDLAVLYSKKAKELQPASLGASQVLRVGESVVAIGSPLGLSSTVTAGIVSALQRPVTTGDSGGDGAASYINAVQTDAAINPGNSGGPLVNLLGQVVGVNSAIATTGGGSGEAGNIGVGFAIPIEQVRITADQILRTGEARYPVIGAKVQTGERGGEGALIDEVIDGTPADDSGMKKGDLVVALEGDKITDGIALIVSIRTHQPGETLAFTVERDGEEKTIDVTLDAEVG